MPEKIHNWINGNQHITENIEFIEKYNPSDGNVIFEFVNSNSSILDLAINSAKSSFDCWSKINPVNRGKLLDKFVSIIFANKHFLSSIISLETGKSLKNAELEVDACISLGNFYSSEGMRLYANSLTSGIDGKTSFTTRCPIGIAALIVPANTPLANIVWKLFPALICGNTVIIKSSEDAPKLAYEIARLSKESNIPDGVINVLHGKGIEIGQKLIENPLIPLISFTGSTQVGKNIAEIAGRRLARVSLELGGKNPIIICSDADFENALKWTLLSAFSNAGQRCAASSRILIEEGIYNKFIKELIVRTLSLKIGINNEDDLGPVINLKQQESILNNISKCINDGGVLLCGGDKPKLKTNGFYINPTLIELHNNNFDLLKNEIFGPVATIQKVKDIKEALSITNDSEYGLTSAIHTSNIDKAIWFAQNARTGIVNVNIGTYGSEPHMPFGGFSNSGNGTREPGVEAINFYSELKNISILVRETNI